MSGRDRDAAAEDRAHFVEALEDVQSALDAAEHERFEASRDRAASEADRERAAKDRTAAKQDREDAAADRAEAAANREDLKDR